MSKTDGADSRLDSIPLSLSFSFSLSLSLSLFLFLFLFLSLFLSLSLASPLTSDCSSLSRKNMLKKKSETLLNFVLLVKIGVKGTIRRDIDEEQESQTLKPFIAQKWVPSDQFAN